MSAVIQTSSFNSSVASSQASPFNSQDDMETTKVKHYVKELLKARIFLGRYVERRLIDQRVGYRDVVLISAAESDLKKDLIEAQHKLRAVFPNTHWIGITDSEVLGISPSGLCLCTEIENQPFGPFWFQIKSLKFREDEIMISVKCIRHISDSFLELEPILTGAGVKKIREKIVAKADSTGDTPDDTYSDFVTTLKSALSISNVKEFVTFLVAFVIAIFTGSTAFVNFLGNFILALLREVSLLVKNSTPAFLGVLDFFSKIVGGFYILMAMFFKPSNRVPPNKRSIGYQNQRYQYDDRFNYDGKFD